MYSAKCRRPTQWLFVAAGLAVLLVFCLRMLRTVAPTQQVNGVSAGLVQAHNMPPQMLQQAVNPGAGPGRQQPSAIDRSGRRGRHRYRFHSGVAHAMADVLMDFEVVVDGKRWPVPRGLCYALWPEVDTLQTELSKAGQELTVSIVAAEGDRNAKQPVIWHLYPDGRDDRVTMKHGRRQVLTDHM